MSKDPQSLRGAVQAKTKFRDKFTAWQLHHRQSARESLGRILQSPLASLMTCLVVAIALALPTTLLVALNNLQILGDSWDANPKISVFINVRAREEAVRQLQKDLQAFAEINDVEYISPEQALQEFQAMSGFGEILGFLDENPLPPTLVVTPVSSIVEPASLKTLAMKIGEKPIVDTVDLDMDWVRRLQELMVLGRKIVTALAGLLSLGVLLSLGNTIRLAIESRKEEIIITKLVGGSNGFVRRPFLYSGAWYGFLGGVVACILVFAGFSSIKGTVANLAAAYQSQFFLQGLGFSGNLGLLAVSTILGLMGAWLAVGRHLSEIEPR